MIRKRFQSIFATALALVFVLTAPISAAAGESTDKVAAVNSEVTTDSEEVLTGYDFIKDSAKKKADLLVNSYGVTSVQYAVIDNGEIVVSGQSGVYSKTNNTMLNNETMYGIASISKVFTAAAVMKLVDEGQVELDKPVTTYIKDFEMKDDRYKDITVRMLLNHSSGIMGTTFSNISLYEDNDKWAHDNLLKSLKKQSLKADPGAFSVYCNDGFSLAEILVERVSGLTFSNYLTKYIYNPSGLKNTKSPLDKFYLSKMARGYDEGGDKSLPVTIFNAIGTGGLISTAEDLCEFSRIFMKDSNNVLTKESVKAMENKEYLNGFWKLADEQLLGFGLGWDNVATAPYNTYGVKALVKGGDAGYYHGNLTVIPEHNMAVAVLSSGGASTYCQLVAQDLALNVLKEKKVIDEIKPDKVFEKPQKVDMPVEMKQFAGIYGYSTQALQIDITDEGSLLVKSIYAPDTVLAEYTYVGDGRFAAPDGGNYFSFERETNGSVYLFNGGYLTMPGLGLVAYNLYDAQKLENNKVTAKALQAWKSLEGKFYFGLNEKYSSQGYAFGTDSAYITLMKQLTGFVGTAAIISEDTAKIQMHIPGNSGRDLLEYRTYKEGKINYLEVNGAAYIEEASIKNLSTKSKSTVTINKSGHAQWFKISSKAADKKIKVTLPKKSSFAVYDSMGVCVNFSLVSGKNTVKLPKNGYIVFVGDPSAKFTVQYQ